MQEMVSRLFICGSRRISDARALGCCRDAGESLTPNSTRSRLLTPPATDETVTIRSRTQTKSPLVASSCEVCAHEDGVVASSGANVF